MRIAILSICCLFFMLSSVKAQQAYYVSLEGHDMTGDGSFENPWRTWKKGFESVSAGDTLYIRGGEYIETDDRGGGAIRVEYLEGTKENPTCFFAYPEDYEAGNIPILDGRNSEGSSQGYNGAISFSFSKHLKFKGLTVRNFYQIDVSDRGLPQSQLAVGFNGTGNLNCHFENITVHDIGGRGIYWRNGYQGGMTIDSTYFINCDVYNCVDPYSYYTNNDQIVDNAGNGADGYFIQAYRYVYYHDDPELFRSYVLIENCRAWRCADDGFNLDGNAHMELKNCWSFNNDVYSDYPKSEGNGFKLGTVISEPADTIYRKLTNCIAANCGLGYTHNNGLDGYWPRSQMYIVHPTTLPVELSSRILLKVKLNMGST